MLSSEYLVTNNNIVNSDRIIYTPTDFAKTNLNYLQEVGILNVLQVHEAKRSGLSSYLFFIVMNGSGTFTTNGISYSIKKGDCVFVDCMMDYCHKSSDDLWTLKWVHFNSEAMPNIYEKYCNRGGNFVFRPNDESFQLFSSIISDIQNIASSTSYIKDMEINEKITSLLTEIMRNSWNPERKESLKNKMKDLNKIREYIDANFAQEISLDNLSQIFFINKFYLTRLFKERYGVTINKYQTQVRITNAKKLLRFTDLSIEQISDKCGYNDANFFIRVFKNSEGMTPGKFRQKWNV